MKQAEVEVGGRYLTKIGGALVAVVVVQRVEDHNGRTKFRVRRPEQAATLPKARASVALRPLPAPRQARRAEPEAQAPLPDAGAPHGAPCAPRAIISPVRHLRCPECGASSATGLDDFSPPLDEAAALPDGDPAQCLACLHEAALGDFRRPS